MCDQPETVVLKEEVEKRRQYFVKLALEKRIEFLTKKGCDPEILKQLKGDELVQTCLIAEGLVAGALPIKKQEPVTTAQPQSNIDPMMMMMQMMQQMREDREEAKKEALRREDENKRREAELKEQARVQAERYERYEMAQREEAKKEALKREEENMRREEENKREALRRDEENMRREAELKEQARIQAERHEEQMRAQIEAFERMQEAKIAEDRAAREGRREKDGTKENKIKMFGDLLKHVLFNMPNDINEIPVYLDTLDRIFTEYNVPNEIRINLVNPYLSSAARKLIVSLPADDLTDYEHFKAALLREFALTPNKYRDLFWNSVKKPNETFVTYATRLDSLFSMYLKSRNVEDFDGVKSLMISDKLKSVLPQSILIEINKKELETFLKPHDLGKLSDRCVADQNEFKSTSFGLNKFSGKQAGKNIVCFSCKGTDHYASDPVCPNYKGAKDTPNAKQANEPGKYSNANKNFASNTAQSQSNSADSKPKESCTFCGNANHTFAKCFHRQKGLVCKYCSRDNHASHMCRYKDRQVRRVNFVGASTSYARTRSNLCDKNVLSSSCSERNPVVLNDNRDHVNDDLGIDIVRLLELSNKHGQVDDQNIDSNEYEQVQQINFVHSDVTGSNASENTKHVIPIGLIDLKIGDKWSKVLVDSGAEISVIRKDTINTELLTQSAYTTVNLHGAFGQKIEAQLVNLPCSVVNTDTKLETNCLYITAAVTDDLKTYSLITPQDYNDMLNNTDVNNFISQAAHLGDTEYLASDDILQLDSNKQNSISDISSALEIRIINATNKQAKQKTKTATNVNSKGSSTASTSTQNKTATDLGKTIVDCPLAAAESSIELHNEMVKLQNSDPSLESCIKMAKAGKSEFFVRDLDKLLYRKTNMFGFQVHQLVLPESKRLQVLQMAHDSLFEGGHFAFKKTLQRVQTCFYWPTMRRDIERYTQSCKHCQMHKRVTVHDRVPIQAVMRPPAFGDTLSVDLVGPLDPPSSRGHKYILCAVDQTTKWAEVACLRAATAKETCDALLLIFARIGIPRILVCDNATNLVSQLNKKFLETLGIEVRTSTPFHPEGNSIVERFIQTLKKLLRVVVSSDKPREWDKKVEYLLWAYRSLPHSTLGVSPYQMVFGKLPRGPLSVLRDKMTGVETGHVPVSNSVKDYCDKLIKDLEIGHDIASKQCDTAQQQYVSHYNLRSRNKSFSPGDQVVVLFPDSTNKLVSKFQGPGTIHSKLNDYAYMVAMPNGAIRRLHANKLRAFVPRVSSVGVVFEDEEDFGNLPYYPSAEEITTDIDWSKVDLSNLDSAQQDQIRALIIKHKNVFKDKPGRCNVGSHYIELENGAKPKKKTPYRIPEKLKAEVDRQVEELLADGLISESTSAWAHPIVCVAKPDNTIRLCVNYTDVNAVTIPDRSPMPRIDDLLQEVSKSKYISTLDCTSGYWQLSVHPESRDKTAFTTHRGLYEWNVLSFGLRNAGASFQKTINTILKAHRKYACAYIDDTSVHSAEWDEHLQHLDAVLTAFGEAGMTLKLSKCKFGQSSVKYVGHVIGSGNISADQSKISAILNLPIPTTKKLWRSFIGMVNYYRAYIPNMAQLLIPLTELTKNKMSNKVEITEAVTKSFEELKVALCSPEVLRTAQYDRDFIIQCDASFYAVGACLAQIDDDGSEHPIAFASSKLSDVQRRWSTIEKEGYAIIFALRKFDSIIFGQNIILFTDHNPLHYLTNSLPKSSKLTRWSLALQRYNLTIKHRAGKLNANCDALSRL